ncbi:putative extracellular matrix protein [Cavenderia fasciculata]|uniref:Extracellular matrix protein n=1 Tax=Cavenderia fasciculata TaxID=261658 RepID=F4Q841_CACFS|nr:putative extracellular matrix protein [Cavenderia fasciculata]EGG15941.1 putative extracellular matrix protein [Cavenderia fasciculata]|eukprot:XP_004352266.1 putative extracellular matrix protein [Cavenderia fasciculata]
MVNKEGSLFFAIVVLVLILCCNAQPPVIYPYGPIVYFDTTPQRNSLNSDFQNAYWTTNTHGEKGLVDFFLGPDATPVYLPIGASPLGSVQSPASFASYFQEVQDVSIQLNDYSNYMDFDIHFPQEFVYESNPNFQITGQGYDDKSLYPTETEYFDSNGQPQNFHWCASTTIFVELRCKSVSFRNTYSNGNLWIFANNFLVADNPTEFEPIVFGEGPTLLNIFWCNMGTNVRAFNPNRNCESQELCSDGLDCTSDHCDDTTGTCSYRNSCPPSLDACLVNKCDPASNVMMVIHVQWIGAIMVCGHAEQCNTTSLCESAHCRINGFNAECYYNDLCVSIDGCIIGSCVSQDQGCQFVALECDDGDPSTIDACIDGACTTIDCSTTDLCEDAVIVNSTCIFVPNCLSDDKCFPKLCDQTQGCVTNAIDCDDGLDCTRDSCLDGFCVHDDICSTTGVVSTTAIITTTEVISTTGDLPSTTATSTTTGQASTTEIITTTATTTGQASTTEIITTTAVVTTTEVITTTGETSSQVSTLSSTLSDLSTTTGLDPTTSSSSSSSSSGWTTLGGTSFTTHHHQECHIGPDGACFGCHKGQSCVMVSGVGRCLNDQDNCPPIKCSKCRNDL